MIILSPIHIYVTFFSICRHRIRRLLQCQRQQVAPHLFRLLLSMGGGSLQVDIRSGSGPAVFATRTRGCYWLSTLGHSPQPPVSISEALVCDPDLWTVGTTKVYSSPLWTCQVVWVKSEARSALRNFERCESEYTQTDVGIQEHAHLSYVYMKVSWVSSKTVPRYINVQDFHK